MKAAILPKRRGRSHGATDVAIHGKRETEAWIDRIGPGDRSDRSCLSIGSVPGIDRIGPAYRLDRSWGSIGSVLGIDRIAPAEPSHGVRRALRVLIECAYF